VRQQTVELHVQAREVDVGIGAPRRGQRRRQVGFLGEEIGGAIAHPPGFDEDMVVSTTSEWLAKWHMGRISLGAAMHDGVMSVRGPSDLVHALSTLGISKFAGVEPAST